MKSGRSGRVSGLQKTLGQSFAAGVVEEEKLSWEDGKRCSDAGNEIRRRWTYQWWQSQRHQPSSPSASILASYGPHDRGCAPLNKQHIRSSPYFWVRPFLAQDNFSSVFSHFNTTHPSSPFSKGSSFVPPLFPHADAFSQKLFSLLSCGTIYTINIVFITYCLLVRHFFLDLSYSTRLKGKGHHSTNWYSGSGLA